METNNGNNSYGVPTTIEELAGMINRTMVNKTDFERLEKKMDENFKWVNEEFKGVDEEFKGVDENFEEVFKRLDRMEDILLESHNNRITQLEKDMREVRELLKVQLVFKTSWREYKTRIKKTSRCIGMFFTALK